MKIGIPRALLYFNYGIMWRSFFESLGHEVIVSQRTNNDILTDGVMHCVDDACLPVKIFHGHIKNLAGKADIIFVPRLISIRRGEYICPKFIGLPEMVKNSIPDLPPLLIVDFNFHKSSKKGLESLYVAGLKLGASYRQIQKAIKKAGEDLSEFKTLVINGENVLDLLEHGLEQYKSECSFKTNNGDNTYKGKIGLIGHPYLVFDEFINMDICNKLRKRNYKILYPENIGEQAIDSMCGMLPKKLFWSYGKKLLGSGLSMIKNHKVDGIIFLSSFGCGIDSFIGELLHRFNQRGFMVPYTMITFDEHSGTAGFDTRLEAFIDMMEWRNTGGYNVSAHGDDIYSRQSSV